MTPIENIPNPQPTVYHMFAEILKGNLLHLVQSSNLGGGSLFDFKIHNFALITVHLANK